MAPTHPQLRGLRGLRYSRLAQRASVWGMVCAVRVLRALPSRWVLRIADFVGSATQLLSPRARRVGRDNLRVVFGDRLDSRERKRILRASARQVMRSILLLLHLQPLTEARYRRWVDVPEGLEDDPRFRRLRDRGGLLVSGHVGNWELLLGTRVVFPHLPPMTFLAEQIPHQAINEVLTRLRSHADLRGALRRGGAMAASAAVRKGGIAAMLVDRNVRRSQGGRYVPCFGIAARTTPLPARLALRYDVPLHPIFCLPIEGERYRLWVGPDLTEDLPPDPDLDVRELALMTRMNDVIEELVRADPVLWNWNLKRFKSRPTRELGPYPGYSEYNPDTARQQPGPR